MIPQGTLYTQQGTKRYFPPPFPFVYNVTRANTAGLRSAIFGAAGGTARKSVAWVGDSTEVGNQSSPGNGGALNALRTLSPSIQLAALLTARGIPTKTDNFMGSVGASNANNFSNYDPRFAIGTGGTIGGNLLSIGGSAPGSNGSSAGMVFARGTNFTVAELLFMDPDPASAILVRNDGGLVTSITNSGVVGTPRKQTITMSSTAVVTLRPSSSAAFIFWIGVSVYNTGDTAMNLIPCGLSGNTSVIAASTLNVYSPPFAFAVLAPDHTFIELTINDANILTPMATYKANIQSLINVALASGTCTLVIGTEVVSSAIPLATQQAYWQAIVDLAVLNGLSYISQPEAFGSYAAANTAGYMAADGVHMTAAGYAQKAVWQSYYFLQVAALGA